MVPTTGGQAITERSDDDADDHREMFRQGAHGVDGSLSTFFKTEGFNEMEGEIETTFAIGRRFHQSYLGNVSFGQDLGW